MLDILNNLDRELFLLLNGFNNSLLDFVMFWLSNKFIWIPLYLYFVYLIFKTFGKKGYLILGSLILLITLSDLISVHLFKNIFLRLRPSHEPELQGLVHIVNGYKGGLYGFVSSHAANVFAGVIFLSLMFKKEFLFSH